MENLLRLYGEPSCPHCMAALGFLNTYQVPLQAVSVNGDPVLDAGLKSLFKEVQLPVLVSFATGEVITGFQPGEYERIVKSYIAKPGTESASQVAVGSQPVGQTPEVDIKPTSEIVGTA